MKSKKLTSLVLMLGIPFAAMADTDAIRASNNQFGIQYINSDLDYTETLPNGSKADTESGHVPGFGISLSVLKDIFLGNDYLEGQFSRLNGDSHYVGSYLSPGLSFPIGAYGSLSQSDGAQITNFSVRYGKGFEAGDRFLVTPYAEIGYHKWKRSLRSSCGVAVSANCGSSEDYTNGYVGVGVRGQVSPVARWVLTANALLATTVASNISVKGVPILVTALGTAEGSASLGNSAMYRLGLSADYAFTRKFHGNIGVDYVDFDYGKSGDFALGSSVPNVYEPDSTTKYTTISFGLGYAF
jgi:hypothetical protein